MDSVDIATNLAAAEAKIADACHDCGRDPGQVRLLPVSKTMPKEFIVAAYQAGYRCFGENKVQEAREKSEELAHYPDLQWSMIGHLQTNKAKYVARFASELQTLDSFALAQELERRLEQAGRTLKVLIQVNTSAEPQKSGVTAGEAVELAKKLAHFERLIPTGLMTVAVKSDDSAAVAGCFRQLVWAQQKIQDETGRSWPELSMGMSADYRLAISCGATCVRLGSSIFGARKYSHPSS